MKLLLIRHGQMPSNIAGLLDTAVPGPGLTHVGQEQADAVSEAISGYPIESIYASSMTRAQQTAAPLAQARDLPIHVRDGLREIDAGSYRMRGDDEAVDSYLCTAFSWANGHLDRSVPGGETGTQALGRFDLAIDEIRRSGVSMAAIVSHGAMIRAWIAARAVNVDSTYMATHGMSNTGVAVMNTNPAFELVSWQGTAIGDPSLSNQRADGPTGITVPAR